MGTKQLHNDLPIFVVVENHIFQGVKTHGFSQDYDKANKLKRKLEKESNSEFFILRTEMIDTV
ncbi:MAG: hypothetical protein ACOCP4_04265 [Candidatus Woesearchaeota archaeon]